MSLEVETLTMATLTYCDVVSACGDEESGCNLRQIGCVTQRFWCDVAG